MSIASDALTTSAFAQLLFAVTQGWGLVAFFTGRKNIGPFRNYKRFLQSHIGNFFMAIICLAVAANHPSIPALLCWLLILGSWMMPQSFLMHSCMPEMSLSKSWVRFLSAPMFLLIQVAYTWLLIDWLLLD